jgi:hypothetical protein
MTRDFIYEIPKEALPIIDIHGRKYFFNKERIEIQCARCLYVFEIHVKPDPEHKDAVRRIYIRYPEDCFCYRNEQGKV